MKDLRVSSLVLCVAVLAMFWVGCSADRDNPFAPSSHDLHGDRSTHSLQREPAGYYDTVDGTDGSTLRATLHEIIDDHTRYPYTSSSTDTWDILESADEDPMNAGNILDVYLNASYPKVGGGNTNYNREHSWPKSYGFPSDVSANYPYTDTHALFLSNDSYNSSRSNKPYRECSSGCTEKPTLLTNGVGGGSGVYPGNSNWTSGSGASGSWETWVDRRGDVARALFYLDLRYEGGLHNVTGVSEPDLVLTDDEALIAASNTGSNEIVAYMGMLTVLLAWHAEDPVDDKERNRNDVVFGFQGNRNPFIDYPEWVDCIFAGSCDGGGDPPGGGGGIAWINEFHYDNSSTDVGEFVEIAGSAGLDLSAWSVVGYNGSGGGNYKTVALSGVIADQQGGFGTLDFAFSGMQNGPPDGLALVDGTGTLVEFISYEGGFTATDGAASGVASVNIGVSETTSTPVGYSLQLSGTGATAADFSWQAPAAETRGFPNTGQSFSGGTPDTTPPAAPSSLAAMAGDGSISLDWADNGESDLAGYTVYRSTSSGGPYSALNGALLSASNHDDTSVSNGTSYYYVVTAEDNAGNESANSAEVVATPQAPGTVAWINEFHYDDAGSDQNEFVEVAGTAGLSLSGWQLVAYNGNGGGNYKAVSLTGTIPNLQAGFGVLSVSFSGLQNGAPDGIALVDDQGTVVEFLSYEGSFTATSGPASGMTSTNIGVSESGSGSKNDSLQRTGTGTSGADFSWQSPMRSTRNAVNTGQSFGSPRTELARDETTGPEFTRR